VLAETRMPNLASRAMGLALRNLPEQWQEKHGYHPLLAETFTDIGSFEGTCYKASNWEPCGLTKGFEPTHRSDFYREHKRPKKLWLKTLSRNTRVILTGLDITAAKRLYQKVDLRNAVVTGDALHCERENMQLVIENNGDFLLQLKGNQPTALAEAQRIAASGSPLLPAKQKIADTVG